MLRWLYDKMPPRLRASVKTLLSASGHRRHFLDPLKARYLARTKKRYAVVAPKLAKRLGFANISSLKGARCMEFGCGMVPTELVYFWYLGAIELIAVDYNRIGHFRYIREAIAGVDDVQTFDPTSIDYRAPFNMRDRSIPGLNFIHSESVLEHIAPPDVPFVLRNLADSLAPGGVMIHSIDLRDHLDPNGDAFAFLTDPYYDPGTDYDARGNRMRRSDWIEAFANVSGVETVCHHEISTTGRPIPRYPDDDSAPFVVMVSRRYSPSTASISWPGASRHDVRS
jgi:SAM-dependent methyltransferase